MSVARVIFLVVCVGFSFEAPAQTAVGANELLRVWTGMLPIILSAPHGGRQPIAGTAPRCGADTPQFATARDHNTDELAHKIAAKLEARFGAKPFMVVALFERKYVDANRPATAAYESERGRFYYESYHRLLRDGAARVLSQWRGGLLLDIHGQGGEGRVIYRGTDNGRSVASLTQRFGSEALIGPKSIFGQLDRRGYSVTPPVNGAQREGRYAGGYIVQTYGSHRADGIDAIQLEIGSELRARANLDRTAADMVDAIAVFAEEFLPLKARSRVVREASSP